MKNITIKLLLCGQLILFSLVCFPYDVIAQIVSPSIVETTLMTVPLTNVHDVVINSDMIQVNNQTLKTIVWDNGTTPTTGGTNQAWIYVKDPIGQTKLIALPSGSKQPDVVLGHDINNGQYLLAVVYVEGPNVYTVINGVNYWINQTIKISTYLIQNVGLPGFNVTPIQTTVLAGGSMNTTIDLNLLEGNPHIDMFSDIGHPFGGFPSLHTFAVVWTEANKVQGKTGEITNINTAALTSLPTINQAKMSDVACLNALDGGHAFVETVYSDWNNLLGWQEYDLTAATITGSGSLSSGRWFGPRIDAMSQYDPGYNASKWQVVSSQIVMMPVPQPPYITPTAPFWEVYGFNNTGVMDKISEGLFPNEECQSGTVAAGIGYSYPANIGNRQYTIGFYPWSTDSIFSRSMNMNSGHCTGNYYLLNKKQAVNYPWDLNRNLTQSHSTNTGLGILSAWNNGKNVVYKESPNAMSFKTTDIKTINDVVLWEAFPNPANNQLTINAPGGTVFELTDIHGKAWKKGIVNDLPLSITELPVGLYLIQLSSGRDSKTIKFIKQ
ncbi:MAG TPA: T9SS type A sorting domain-containing protein [Flavipsychrobacter sp.]|jgi:hypothetical protein|nr:T9SS type A sorting domain-containing protein [Flavipsychrobacter sp.]